MRIIKCCKVNLMQLRTRKKTWICLLLLVVLMASFFAGYGPYAKSLGHPHIAPWGVSGLPTNGMFYAVILTIFLLLIADAPFRTAQQQLVLQRIGKRGWITGQILYLFVLSVAFTVLLWILSWIFYAPMIEWTPGWGKVIRTQALYPSAEHFFLRVPKDVLQNTTGLMATLWMLGMQVLVCFFLGCIVLLSNLWFKRGSGVFIAAVFAFLYYFLRQNATMRYFPTWLTWLSPVSWVDRSIMGHPNMPSLAYSIIMISLLCILSVTLAICMIHKNDIVVKE